MHHTDNRYQHLFFDLDHTLWDFETNSRAMLANIHTKYHLAKKGIRTSREFITKYEEVNEQLWSQYRKGQIDKSRLRNTRFAHALQLWEIHDAKLAADINEYYLAHSPYQKGLMPNAVQTLTELKERYTLHIITNGFKEIQEIKLRESGLIHFFETVTISELVGVQKPHPDVFLYALKAAQSTADKSLYIGDHLESDVQGGKNVGIDQVFFNPSKVSHNAAPTYEISDLGELCSFL